MDGVTAHRYMTAHEQLLALIHNGETRSRLARPVLPRLLGCPYQAEISKSPVMVCRSIDSRFKP